MSKVIAEGQVDCRCNNHGCGNIETIGLDDFSFEESEKSDHNTGMGAEICHSCSLGYDCPNCEEEYQVMIEVWEYPVGVIQTVNIVCSGCELLESDEEIKKMIRIEA